MSLLPCRTVVMSLLPSVGARLGPGPDVRNCFLSLFVVVRAAAVSFFHQLPESQLKLVNMLIFLLNSACEAMEPAGPLQTGVL